MTTSIQSLQVLLDRALADRDHALLAFQQALQRAESARAQATQLVDYRGDYQRRWSGEFSRAGAIEIVHAYQNFRGRLEQAVEQQSRMADHNEALVVQAREALQACELRAASVRKLIERRLSEQRRAAERRDQKHTDEAAQRRAWRETRL